MTDMHAFFVFRGIVEQFPYVTRVQNTLDAAGVATTVVSLPTGAPKLAASRFFRTWGQVLRKGLAGQRVVVHAVNEEVAAAFLPLKVLPSVKVIADIRDSVYHRSSAESDAVKGGLRRLHAWVLSQSDQVVATDERRLELMRPFMNGTPVQIVENAPHEHPVPTLDTPLDGPVRVYLSGRLVSKKGLRTLVRAIDLVDDVEVVAAGWCRDDFARGDFLNHPKVNFVGSLTAAESVELGATMDAFYCYYEPSTVNQIYASPSRVYDAMAVGRPVLVNSEAKIAEWVRRCGLGLAGPYDAAEALAANVEALRARRANEPAEARRVRQYYKANHSWAVMQERIVRAYEQLSKN